VQKELILHNVTVDRFEDDAAHQQTLEQTTTEQQTPEQQTPEQQTPENIDEHFSSASSGSEDSEGETEETEKIILCTKCNIALPSDPVERRNHYKSSEHVAKLLEKVHAFDSPKSTPRTRMESQNNSVSRSRNNSVSSPLDAVSRADVQRSQKVFFRNPDQSLIAVYRQTLAPKGEYPTHSEILTRLETLRSPKTKTMIVLQGGGHFVAAVYQNNECIRHKTFKAYMVRGSGGVQSQADKRQGAHKSIGAQMRRQNQIHFEKKIDDLLKQWKSENEFETCLLKFVHVPHYTKRNYFNDDLFDKNDNSVRTIPFSTVKPGLLEANRIFNELYCCTIYKPESTNPGVEALRITQEAIFEASKTRKSDALQAVKDKKAEKRAEARRKGELTDSGDEYVPYSGEFTATCPRPSISKDGCLAISEAIEGMQPKKVKIKNKSRERRISEIENGGFSSGASSRSQSRSRNASSSSPPEEPSPLNSLNRICATGNLEEFNQLCTLIPYEIWLEEKLDANGRRPLHVATRSGNIIILKKLLELGANPEIQDSTKQTAYQTANDKTIRNIFRRFRHDKPTAWHWPATKIDDPLSIEEEEAQKAKKKGKSKKNTQNKKEKKEEAEKVEKFRLEQEKLEQKKSSQNKTSLADRNKKGASDPIAEREKRLAAIQKRLDRDYK